VCFTRAMSVAVLVRGFLLLFMEMHYCDPMCLYDVHDFSPRDAKASLSRTQVSSMQ